MEALFTSGDDYGKNRREYAHIDGVLIDAGSDDNVENCLCTSATRSKKSLIKNSRCSHRSNINKLDGKSNIDCCCSIHNHDVAVNNSQRRITVGHSDTDCAKESNGNYSYRQIAKRGREIMGKHRPLIRNYVNRYEYESGFPAFLYSRKVEIPKAIIDTENHVTPNLNPSYSTCSFPNYYCSGDSALTHTVKIDKKEMHINGGDGKSSESTNESQSQNGHENSKQIFMLQNKFKSIYDSNNNCFNENGQGTGMDSNKCIKCEENKDKYSPNQVVFDQPLCYICKTIPAMVDKSSSPKFNKNCNINLKYPLFGEFQEQRTNEDNICNKSQKDQRSIDMRCRIKFCSHRKKHQISPIIPYDTSALEGYQVEDMVKSSTSAVDHGESVVVNNSKQHKRTVMKKEPENIYVDECKSTIAKSPIEPVDLRVPNTSSDSHDIFGYINDTYGYCNIKAKTKNEFKLVDNQQLNDTSYVRKIKNSCDAMYSSSQREADFCANGIIRCNNLNNLGKSITDSKVCTGMPEENKFKDTGNMYALSEKKHDESITGLPFVSNDISNYPHIVLRSFHEVESNFKQQEVEDKIEDQLRCKNLETKEEDAAVNRKTKANCVALNRQNSGEVEYYVEKNEDILLNNSSRMHQSNSSPYLSKICCQCYVDHDTHDPNVQALCTNDGFLVPITVRRKRDSHSLSPKTTNSLMKNGNHCSKSCRKSESCRPIKLQRLKKCSPDLNINYPKSTISLSSIPTTATVPMPFLHYPSSMDSLHTHFNPSCTLPFHHRLTSNGDGDGLKKNYYSEKESSRNIPSHSACYSVEPYLLQNFLNKHGLSENCQQNLTEICHSQKNTDRVAKSYNINKYDESPQCKNCCTNYHCHQNCKIGNKIQDINDHISEDVDTNSNSNRKRNANKNNNYAGKVLQNISNNCIPNSNDNCNEEYKKNYTSQMLLWLCTGLALFLIILLVILIILIFPRS